jgi:hypothetical protein
MLEIISLTAKIVWKVKHNIILEIISLYYDTFYMFLSPLNKLLSGHFLWFSLVEDVTRGEYNIFSKKVTRDVSKSEKTLSEILYKN